jgi:hypothetical protein
LIVGTLVGDNDVGTVVDGDVVDWMINGDRVDCCGSEAFTTDTGIITDCPDGYGVVSKFGIGCTDGCINDGVIDGSIVSGGIDGSVVVR